MTKEQELFNSIGQEINNSVQSQMFGKPCFKIHGKAFICFFQNEMVFKLDGDVHSNALRLEATQLFDPSGKNRPMKEWVQMSAVYKNMWLQFAKSASDYVGRL